MPVQSADGRTKRRAKGPQAGKKKRNVPAAKKSKRKEVFGRGKGEEGIKEMASQLAEGGGRRT